MNDQPIAIAAQIERAVLLATHGRVGKLHVDQRGNQILMHGRCPTLSCKRLAEDAALLLVGDSMLVNKIEID